MQTDKKKRTPRAVLEEFKEALEAGDTETVKDLVTNHGVSVDEPQQMGGEFAAKSPLLHATSRGHAETCAALLELGANVNACGSTGWAPIHTAASYGNAQILALLIKADADVHVAVETCHTPLAFAVMGMGGQAGAYTCAELLIGAGADVNAVSDMGECATPLITAASRGHLELCRLLVENGADVNARGHTPDQTALAAAVKNKFPEIQAFLRDHGADE